MMQVEQCNRAALAGFGNRINGQSSLRDRLARRQHAAIADHQDGGRGYDIGLSQ